MSTATVANNVLTAEQKATRDLAGSLLDAHFNLAKSLDEAKARLSGRKDTAVKEFARATTPDAIITTAKNVSAAIDQANKDAAAVDEAPKLVSECFEELKKKAPDDVRAVLEERKARAETELNKSTNGQQAFKDDLKFLKLELKNLPKGGSGKGGGSSAPSPSSGSSATATSASPGTGAAASTTAPSTSATSSGGGSSRRRKRRKK